jgi:predicted PurR-regulated permease PerM
MAGGRRDYDHAPLVAVPAVAPAVPAGTQTSRRRPRLRSLALNGLFVLAILYTLRLAREFLLPVALGVLVYLLLRPAVRLLLRFHIPESLGAAVVCLTLLAAVGLGAYALSYPAATWIARAPDSLHKVEDRLRPLAVRVQRVTRTAEEMEKITAVGATGTPQQVTVKQASLGGQLFGGMQSLVAGAVVVLTLAYFLLASGDLFLRKVVQALPRLSDRKRAVEIAHEMERSISGYLFYTTVMNAVFGAGVGLLLWALGMPNPALWGVVAGVTKFVPYLGGLVCTVVLALASLLAFDEPWRVLLVPGVFLVVDTVHGNFVLPALMGRRFTLNAPVVFVGLVFWWFMWGVVGALLAVPLMAALKIVCERVEGLRRIAIFLGDEDEGLSPQPTS